MEPIQAGEGDEDRVVVSLSRIKLFRQCTMAHHYRYVERLEPRQKPIYMELGHLVHELLEYSAKGKDWEARLIEVEEDRGNLFKLEWEHYGDIIKDAHSIVRRYHRRWKHEPLEFLLAEPDFEPVPFTEYKGETIWIIVKPDGLVKSVDGDQWVLERKTVRKFGDVEQRVFDLQTSLYIWGLEVLGYSWSTGVLWDEIRAKRPKIPALTKKGSLSRRKSIDTDWPTYLRAIKKHGLDPNDYQDMKSAITADPEKFYRRIPISTRQPIVKQIVVEAKRTAKQIARRDKPVMELGFQCKSCTFNRICRTRLMGGDVNFVKKVEFTRRERRNAQKKA